MIINVPILGGDHGVFADLSRIGLGVVVVTPKPNFLMKTERPNVEGWGGHVDLSFTKIPGQLSYDPFLVAVSGAYVGFRKRLEYDEVAIISTEDFQRFFDVVLLVDGGSLTVHDIDLKTIHTLKDKLVVQDKGSY